MQYLATLLPLAALAAANPLERRGACTSDACIAAVTGKAALGDDGLRKSHCASFLATTVTPAASTVTVTVTGESAWEDWKRGVSVTVCPNEVPNYASACDESGYSSACSCYGYTAASTTTLTPSTVTKTIYVASTPVAGESCNSGTATVTVTKDGHGGTWSSGTATVTVTVTSAGDGGLSGGPTGSPGKNCLSDSDAKKLTDNFIKLLENTNNNQTGGPTPYPQDVSNATLDPSFQDISDSINFAAGIPLGSITFANKTAFDAGQSQLAQLTVSTLNLWHGCKDITWRYRIESPSPVGFPVVGINHIDVNDAGLMIKQYAEFNSGAFLQDLGGQCAQNPPPPLPTSAAKRRSL